MLARMKLGMFDPPEQVAYARIPYSVNDAPEHDRLARRVAQESLVLLKNDGVLPLRKDLKTIAVVGPTADDLVTLLGNYNGTPSHPVTILAGIRAAVSPGTKVTYARGVDLVEGRQDPRAAEAIPAAFLRPAPGSAEHGLTGGVLPRPRARGRARAHARRPEGRLPLGPRRADGRAGRARRARRLARALPADDFSVRWTGVLVPPATGEYELVVTANDGVRLLVDGQKLRRRVERDERRPRGERARAPRGRARARASRSSTSRRCATRRCGSAGGRRRAARRSRLPSPRRATPT